MCAGLNQDAHQYQILYQEDKPNLVRIHPIDLSSAPPNGVSGLPDPSTPVELLVQEAHRLYREQNYPAVLTLCQHVRLHSVFVCVLEDLTSNASTVYRGPQSSVVPGWWLPCHNRSTSKSNFQIWYLIRKDVSHVHRVM